MACVLLAAWMDGTLQVLLSTHETITNASRILWLFSRQVSRAGCGPKASRVGLECGSQRQAGHDGLHSR